MTLTTDRLVLRPLTSADFEDVHAYGSDPDVTRYTSFGPNSPDDTREFLQRCEANLQEEPRLQHHFGITVRENGRVIGGVGFQIDQPAHSGAEMGYVLHRDFWGQGIAVEASSALIAYGFSRANLHRIVARCHPDNQASARVMQKLGMTYEGRQRDVMWMKGAWWDFLVYSILEPEWKARNGLTDAAAEEIL